MGLCVCSANVLLSPTSWSSSEGRGQTVAGPWARLCPWVPIKVTGAELMVVKVDGGLRGLLEMAFPLSSSPQTLVTVCISVPGPSLIKCKRAALLSGSAPSRASCCPRLSLPRGLRCRPSRGPLAPPAQPRAAPREQDGGAGGPGAGDQDVGTVSTCVFPHHRYIAESLEKFLAK